MFDLWSLFVFHFHFTNISNNIILTSFSVHPTYFNSILTAGYFTFHALTHSFTLRWKRCLFSLIIFPINVANSVWSNKFHFHLYIFFYFYLLEGILWLWILNLLLSWKTSTFKFKIFFKDRFLKLSFWEIEKFQNILLENENFNF